jgi:hypothetical protein
LIEKSKSQLDKLELLFFVEHNWLHSNSSFLIKLLFWLEVSFQIKHCLAYFMFKPWREFPPLIIFAFFIRKIIILDYLQNSGKLHSFGNFLTKKSLINRHEFFDKRLIILLFNPIFYYRNRPFSRNPKKLIFWTVVK